MCPSRRWPIPPSDILLAGVRWTVGCLPALVQLRRMNLGPRALRDKGQGTGRAGLLELSRKGKHTRVAGAARFTLLVALMAAASATSPGLQCGGDTFPVEPAGISYGFEGSPEWSPNGDLIAFTYNGDIYTVTAEGSDLRLLDRDASSPSISPDGTRIAYVSFDGQSELVVSEIDGSKRKVLTKTKNRGIRFRNTTWSPDGRSITFLSRRDGSDGIYLMASDGSDLVRIAEIGGLGVRGDSGVPVWSPNGVHMAFRDYHTELRDGEYHDLPFIVVFRRDGTGFLKIIESKSWLSQPSWSPDGRRMAVMGEDEDGRVVIYTAAVTVGGWRVRQILLGPQPSKDYRNHLRGIAWSLDGSEIRFYGAAPEFGLHAVNPDGTGLRTLLGSLPDDAELSPPGGDRIAVLARSPAGRHEVVLYTLKVEGDYVYRQNLVRNVFGKLLVEISEPQAQAQTISCSTGKAVANPDRNPDLVSDCETLLRLRSKLSGEEVTLNWAPNVPIRDWTGIYIGGSPRRVQGINFAGLFQLDSHLTGNIPAELGSLLGLKTLALHGQKLKGGIPPDLGNLDQLEKLILSDNQLEGGIPPELGNLSNLIWLYLSENALTGVIPVELVQLKKLTRLIVDGNNLTGCIPTDLVENSHLFIRTDGLEKC